MPATMRLAVDNSRPPLPGSTHLEKYRAALARGECMACHRTDRGAVTAGVRKPEWEVVSWRWYALCAECAVRMREAGYPVMVQVPALPAPDDPLEAVCEAFRETVAAISEDRPRYKTTVARYPGKCPVCGEAIGEGDPIALAGKRWAHCRCAS